MYKMIYIYIYTYLYELLHACFQDTDATVSLCKFFEYRRQQQQRAGQMLRKFKQLQKGNARAKDDAGKAMAELKKKKRALAAQMEASQQSDAQLKALKHFDPVMLGQGRPRGGDAGHRKQRMDFLERVKAKYPVLRPGLANNWVLFKRKFEERHCRIIGFEGKSYGSWFLNEMKGLIAKRQGGSLDALEKWIDEKMEKHPTMFGGSAEA